MASSAETQGPLPGLPWGLAWRLAVGQLFSWGILYYAFTVVVGPMAAGTGWSRSFLNLGLTLGLLAWGVGAYPAGRWIQRHGARKLMAAASLLGGFSLVLMGLGSSPGLYLVAWVLLGAAMAGALYEPAFAVVTAAFGASYRKGIVLITLVGGFASTVFIPIAQVAVTQLGWREALVLLGLVQAGFGFPLHWWGLPGGRAKPVTAGNVAGAFPAACARAGLRTHLHDRRFIGLSVWFAAHAAGFTGLLFQLVPFLEARQVPTEAILAAMAVMGPMQVTGRLTLSFQGERFSSVGIGFVAMASLLAGLISLWLLPATVPWLCVFAGLFGLGNGMLTIVRGTAVAEFFGRGNYAEISGAIAAPAVIAKAVAPLAFAALWSAGGRAEIVPLVALLLLGVSLGGLMLLTRCAVSLDKAPV